MHEPVSLDDKFATFTEQWAPRIVARYEGHEVRIARLEGEFGWHSHDHDELFLILRGELDIELRERTVTLREGELFVVPRETEHRPVARKGEVRALLLDPAESPNTGNNETATRAVEA
ncbi:cupin domain-containing protein [Erythrobacter litoralis]|uniref:cupin domain-containing protein n=1 Tax=Erythrobacter litoralis TaxID=39960 RepID=UPI0024353A20|nr:cupin domain-containing protein [Erythrobacter litoralis]MDG6080150.1 cupin domain-containing protein [Erythrobacter litoralis]